MNTIKISIVASSNTINTLPTNESVTIIKSLSIKCKTEQEGSDTIKFFQALEADISLVSNNIRLEYSLNQGKTNIVVPQTIFTCQLAKNSKSAKSLSFGIEAVEKFLSASENKLTILLWLRKVSKSLNNLKCNSPLGLVMKENASAWSSSFYNFATLPLIYKL